MNYNVVSLNGGNQFDLSGVRFDGKSFIFWKNKSTQKVTEVVVIFDQKYASQKLRDGVVILSLQGLKDYKDIMKALMIFKDIVKNFNIQFHFIVGSEQEEKMAQTLGANLGLSYFVQNINKKEEQRQEQNLKQMEEEIKSQSSRDLSTGGDKIVEKYDNGVLRQITVHGDTAYENVDYLNTEEKKMSLLKEWMKDPKRAYELSKLSTEARNELLMQAINYNNKGYRLESASELSGQSEVADLTKDTTGKVDGKGNTELGVGLSSNRVFAVERQGDNATLVNPTVKNVEINSNGINVGVNSGTSVNSDSTYIEEEDVQGREGNVDVDKYYLDGDGYIYKGSNLDNAIGKDGDGDFEVIYNENEKILFENSVSKGNIMDYPMNLGKQNTKGKTLVYKKERMDMRSSNKSGGFVNLPIIIFVISFLLLVGSGIILFMMK